MAKKDKKNNLLKADSEGSLCMAKARIFNTQKQMYPLYQAMQGTTALDPNKADQALSVIKVYMYAGIAQRFVPKTLWTKAGIDEYPPFSDDERILYCATPLHSSKTTIQTMVSKINVPIVNNEARLTTPQARCHFEKVCKDLNITAGSVNLMPDTPLDEEDMREAQATIESLKGQVRKWRREAKAFHKAMVLWQAYAVAPNEESDPSTWPTIDTGYNAPIELPPFVYPTAGEGRFGANVITASNTYASPAKRRRITFVNHDADETDAASDD